MNRFVFIIPYRNIRLFIKQCCDSLLSQNNKNWIAIFCDDNSSDGTSDMIPNDPRFVIKKNKERITALPNIHYGILDGNLQSEDIICILDGDDFLVRNDAVDILDKLYNDDTLLTYGQYIWPNGAIGHCKPYDVSSFIDLRKGGYWASHIRTFKYKLYKELMVQDPELSCYKDKDGNFYTITYDIAIMTPLMEIAGFERIKFNPIPIYYYRLHDQNDHNVDGRLQRSVADEIFNKSPLKKSYNI